MKIKVINSLLLLAATLSVFAQYPEIPEEVQAASDAKMSRAKELSDEAWEKAWPQIKKEIDAGKPYRPWAEKPSDLPQANIPAFPGAEGGGMYSFGGRGGKVFVVTNLNDSGEGSFRWACEQGGARIIVFNVAGVIKLETPVSIRAPYVTIVGNTAPGDGVCITGESVWIDTHDVVVRHMRFRRGATEVGRRDDALGGNGVGNIIIDHVSASWGLDENISMYRHVYVNEDGKRVKLPAVNVTIQNTISSEALDTYNHAFGSTIGGLNSTFARNLWASNISRNPSVGMYGSFNMVNNVLFNWWNRSVDGGDDRSEFNIINNYYKPGPITPTDKPIAYRILKPESSRDKSRPIAFGKAFVDGNITEGYPEVTADNWKGGVQLGGRDLADFIDDIKMKEPFDMLPVKVLDTKDAYEYVLANAGATLPKRDAVDERVVETVRTGKIQYREDGITGVGSEYINRRLPEDSYKKGIITHISQVGGLPEYKGKSYKDSDNDGMPDAYEKKNGLNPKDASDAIADINGDGYTNIEMFIFNIDPKAKTDWTKPENNRDTLMD
ncbi:MAG: polysaccharide lyase [Cyclobacteriaceae bacterium]